MLTVQQVFPEISFTAGLPVLQSGQDREHRGEPVGVWEWVGSAYMIISTWLRKQAGFCSLNSVELCLSRHVQDGTVKHSQQVINGPLVF